MDAALFAFSFHANMRKGKRAALRNPSNSFSPLIRLHLYGGVLRSAKQQIEFQFETKSTDVR
jgi:hypothetical protein